MSKTRLSLLRTCPKPRRPLDPAIIKSKQVGKSLWEYFIDDRNFIYLRITRTTRDGGTVPNWYTFSRRPKPPKTECKQMGEFPLHCEGG